MEQENDLLYQLYFTFRLHGQHGEAQLLMFKHKGDLPNLTHEQPRVRMYVCDQTDYFVER